VREYESIRNRFLLFLLAVLRNSEQSVSSTNHFALSRLEHPAKLSFNVNHSIYSIAGEETRMDVYIEYHTGHRYRRRSAGGEIRWDRTKLNPEETSGAKKVSNRNREEANGIINIHATFYRGYEP
jgi:hypothetical protein